MDDRDRDIVLSLRTLGRASLAELARQAGIPKSTVFKRLRKLMTNRIVCGEGDVYLLCKEVYDLL
ncbi:MAG: AsnC family transcriptional regulator, partial [Thermosphaera sp.]